MNAYPCEINDLVKGFLTGTLKEIMARLHAERGSLFLFDPARRELILDACYNPSPAMFKGLRQRVNEGVSGTVVNLKTAVLVRDIARDSRFKSSGIRRYHTPSFISVPLYAGQQLIGVIHVADKASRQAFTPEELGYADTLCRYACSIVSGLGECGTLRAEKNAIARQQDLMRQYAAVGRMAKEIVHHIANPLDGVIRFAGMLRRQPQLQGKPQEFIELICQGLQRIAGITTSLRDFGSQVGIASRPGSASADVNVLLEDALALFAVRMQDRYSVCRQLQEGLPRIEGRDLGHVFVNLIKNALDAMPQGGTLTVCSRLVDGCLRVDVRDNGCGISAVQRELIFEPFFTTKAPGEGTGLGLAICREIIERCGGRIFLESEVGRGTCFSVELPLVQPARGQQAQLLGNSDVG